MPTKTAVVRTRNKDRGPKVKTGCATCRIRRVKCDEEKPSCQRCVRTGRTCDGYASPFKLFISPSLKTNSTVNLQRPTPIDADLLNRLFSIKTIFNVRLTCDEEAEQVLQASLTYPPIQHAISSLRALRQDFESSGQTTVVQQSPSYQHGLREYNKALVGLVYNLTSSSSSALRSVLLCSQIFISIEQVQGNYSAVAQHIIQALKIMREYRVRPALLDPNNLASAHHATLPLVDVFVIKLFMAPCKFCESPNATGTHSSTPPQPPNTLPTLRAITPDMRADLVRTAASTLDFLGKVARIQSIEEALGLLPERAASLNSLTTWLTRFELVRTGQETISESFMRLFHVTLRIILLSVLDASADADSELQAEIGRLQTMADYVGERVKPYHAKSFGRNRGDFGGVVGLR